MRINVIKSSMPPFEEYMEAIRPLWDSVWLTNMGANHEELSKRLCDYLKVPHVSLFVNGHMALEMALQAMDLEGEVITTPFTFASTTHAIVRNGLTPVFCDIEPDTYTIDASKIEDELIDLYIKKISEYGIEEVMLLVPFKEHEGGVTPLNQKIQERLHPEHLQEKEFRLGMKRFRIGDRVMQLKNSDEQVNGECGTVIDIGKSDGEQTVTVKFDRSERTYTDDEADEITLAYACTIHKSQGSEGKCVIIFLHSMHSMLLKKNLVYTGISRSRDECYILGEKSAVLKAIQTTDESRRLTGLSMFLKDESLWRVG